MSEKPLPQIGSAYATADGLACWRPVFDRLQVAHTNDGMTVLTVSPRVGEPFLFKMLPSERDHLVDLLSDKPSTERSCADTDSAAIRQGV